MTAAADRHERSRLVLAFSQQPGPRPTVYFLTPDHPVPAGGIRVIYRHVDILNENGIEARVLHWRAGFRCTWFRNETKVTDAAAATIRHGDLLVVPEIDVDLLARVPQNVRYVIFNQNSHLTWKRAGVKTARFYSPSSGLAAVVCVSDHNRQMLSRAYPSCTVRRVHVGIEEAVFGRGGAVRPRRIAYMPRRSGSDAEQVLALLRERTLLDGWEIMALDGLAHEEVAAALCTTRIFLAFTRQEGFGLPAAEAMAAGCYVIGNDGFGGREFFLPRFSARIESGDIVGFADAVERALRAERLHPDWCSERGRRASQFVLREYSLDRERGEVVSLYSELLGLAEPAEAVRG